MNFDGDMDILGTVRKLELLFSSLTAGFLWYIFSCKVNAASWLAGGRGRSPLGWLGGDVSFLWGRSSGFLWGLCWYHPSRGGFGALMTAPWLFSADTVVGGCERPGSLLNLVSQFSLSVVSDSLWPHGLQHARPPCPSPILGARSNSCPLSQWCHPTISSSVAHFSWLSAMPPLMQPQPERRRSHVITMRGREESAGYSVLEVFSYHLWEGIPTGTLLVQPSPAPVGE